MTIFKVVDGNIVGAEKAMYIESEFEPTDPVVYNPETNKIELSIPTYLVGHTMVVNGELKTLSFDDVLDGLLGESKDRILNIPGVVESIEKAREICEDNNKKKKKK